MRLPHAVALVGSILLLFPSAAAAQHWELEAGVGAWADTQPFRETHRGPALQAGLGYQIRSPLSVRLNFVAARTDFMVEDDDHHRNFLSGALGVGWSFGTDVGVDLRSGLGAMLIDDVNETRADFASSPDFHELIILGGGVRWSRFGPSLRLFGQWHWTDWLETFFDPHEAQSFHRFLLGVGVRVGGPHLPTG